MDDACDIMSTKITELVEKNTLLGATAFAGEYAGMHILKTLDTGRLTHGELVELFERCVRWDECWRGGDHDDGDPYWYVMRTHSGITSNITTYKCMSRRMRTEEDAEDWKGFCESQEKNKRHRFFLVQSSHSM